jgi:hypothetical protein
MGLIGVAGPDREASEVAAIGPVVDEREECLEAQQAMERLGTVSQRAEATPSKLPRRNEQILRLIRHAASAPRPKAPNQFSNDRIGPRRVDTSSDDFLLQQACGALRRLRFGQSAADR